MRSKSRGCVYQFRVWCCSGRTGQFVVPILPGQPGLPVSLEVVEALSDRGRIVVGSLSDRNGRVGLCRFGVDDRSQLAGVKTDEFHT
jgi:hypothetical protein